MLLRYTSFAACIRLTIYIIALQGIQYYNDLH